MSNDAYLQLFIDSCKDYALFILDSKGNIASWNSGAEIIKGYKKEEIIGKHFSVFYPQQAVDCHYPEYELEMASKYGHYEDYGWRVRKDGSKFWANVIITSLKDENGNVVGYGKVTRDLTERRKFEEEIIYLSNHDMLTGLYNRMAFNEILKRELDKSNRNKTSVALLMIDIDKFKNINDGFGHHMGDKLLILFAEQLQKCVRKVDFISRLGGDEFVIILPNIVNESNAERVAKKILECFQKPFKLEEHFFYATVSIGIAISDYRHQDFSTLVKNADIALYTVKEFGRNNYKVFSEDIDSTFKKQCQLQGDLSTALAKNQFFLVYQPQYILPSKKIVGMEALVRWQHPKAGVIMPNNFISLAEKNGIIIHIGEWVLKNACKQYMAWQASGLVNKSIKLAINVSPLQLTDRFMESFIAILNETKMLPQNLELELTESAVMLSPVELDSIFKQLQEIGVSVAIDDFGTGYSSLSRIKELPISSLKIDKSFIDSIDKNKNDAKIVKSIISLGKNLGLKIISEGVETEKQLQLLARYNCKIVQGFYFETPLAADEISHLLKSNEI
jgi:diguanylate cyclase (GGDEF)-like protein/PAS domain S-box-containing protein